MTTIDRIIATEQRRHNVGDDKVHRVIDALCARARRLAPVLGEQTLEAGATNPRPTSGPRRMLAWDLVCLAYSLNAISDDADLVALWYEGIPVADLEYVARLHRVARLENQARRS